LGQLGQLLLHHCVTAGGGFGLGGGGFGGLGGGRGGEGGGDGFCLRSHRAAAADVGVLGSVIAMMATSGSLAGLMAQIMM